MEGPRRARFIRIDERSVSIQKATELFATQEYLSEEQMNPVVEQLVADIGAVARRYETGAALPVIITMLQPRELMRNLPLGLLGKLNAADREAMNSALDSMRQRILQKLLAHPVLREQLPDTELHMISRWVHENKAGFVYGNDLFHKAEHYSKRLDLEFTKQNQSALQALATHLHEEPNPYLDLNLKYYGEDQHGRAAELHHYRETYTLQQALDNPAASNLRCRTAVQVIADAMRGAQYVIAHGLRLTDNRPDNIRIVVDKQAGTVRGQLFDFSGLLPEGFVTNIYTCPEPFRPPERSKTPKAISVEEMLYEFGLTTANCLTHFQRDPRFKELRDIPAFNELLSLSVRMTKREVDFEQALQQLTTLLDQLPE